MFSKHSIWHNVALVFTMTFSFTKEYEKNIKRTEFVIEIKQILSEMKISPPQIINSFFVDSLADETDK